MVQGGTWFGDDRASLTQIARMRRALGEKPLLKWTTPLMDRLLIACAEAQIALTPIPPQSCGRPPNAPATRNCASQKPN